jgi:hypothetical protein
LSHVLRLRISDGQRERRRHDCFQCFCFHLAQRNLIPAASLTMTSSMQSVFYVHMHKRQKSRKFNVFCVRLDLFVYGTKMFFLIFAVATPLQCLCMTPKKRPKGRPPGVEKIPIPITTVVDGRAHLAPECLKGTLMPYIKQSLHLQNSSMLSRWASF